ncbi:uncharacterized protein Gasu_12170 [Galdieria sulphuraria]|uniref:Uncharacterized protein n=1 Tax=Galdieria sulphuraria TaxID=130081 RepID=M2Y690_GALSU|nr:uncharacterized protein Gasu_12170 [Galdieria sulphuraria]EME31543.1 hypothetical protein Gasu_12170 [Galdieria sulphuraria]|eukprot:XP_005708063.1 hypothetical protein Gasu_12170 [Galdieria sulphuraria]
MTLSDEAKFLEWIDNLYSYLKNRSLSLSETLNIVANQWIEYFAKQHCPNISCATLSRLSHVSTLLLERCKQSSCLHTNNLILLRKVLAIWRNSCRSVDMRTFLMDSGFVDKLVSDLETLLEGEGLILVRVVLQLLANVTNDKRRPLCLWRNDTKTPHRFYQLLLMSAKKEYDRNPGDCTLLLAFNMLWNNQFCYLVTSESFVSLIDDNSFWSTFLGWIQHHFCSTRDHNCDGLYWLFVMMEKMAENDVLCKCLFGSNNHLANSKQLHMDHSECNVSMEDMTLFPFVSILRDALLVGEQSIVLSLSDICGFCMYFQHFCCHRIVDGSHVAWLELIAVILADHFSTSMPIYEKEYLVSVVDGCCYVLRLLQEDSSWMCLGDKIINNIL